MDIIDMRRIPAILKKPEMDTGIQRYKQVMEWVRNVDVSKNVEFQKTYENFYTLDRRSHKMRRDYFSFMEKNKNRKPSFEETLRYLLPHGMLEVSFASKLVHTLDPEQPIWDRIVTEKHFGFRKPYNGAKDRDKKAVERYNRYKESFFEFRDSEDGREIIQAFDAAFPDSGFTDMKKVDFVLWQDTDK